METNMEIDDSLYSRQRYMLGDRAMRRMATSSALLLGCDTLGVEIAKNLVLTGIKSLCVSDDRIVTSEDAQFNFYVSTSDVDQRKTRCEACVPHLTELNPYVTVSVSHVDELLEKAIPENSASQSELIEIIKGYDCVIATQYDVELLIALNKICRLTNTKFVCCNVFGLFSSLFCDFGSEFEVYDVNGEEPKEGMIADIGKGEPGVVTCLENRMHGLKDGDSVTFKEVSGMTELNNQIRIVSVLSPYAFSIGGTSDLSSYESGGLFKQVKISSKIHHNTLEAELKNPRFLLPDFGKLSNSDVVHVGFIALARYRKNQRGLPASWNLVDAEKFLVFISEVEQEYGIEIPRVKDTDAFLHLLSFTCRGLLPPLCAAIGGIASQEVLKAITGKYTPLQQWLYLDASELADSSLTGQVETINSDAEDLSGLNACLDKEVVDHLTKMKVFMVGCGAIGCEMLKNLALLGVATNPTDGQAIITDNDIIEKSNLNRQFLFRSHHIRQPKSTVAASSVKGINPLMKIKALEYKVCPDTEKKIFNDSFFMEQDVIINALDNIEARRYVDSRCVTNQRPLVESGTMGPKGHVRVIVPFLTESYSSQNDPPEAQVPYCTLKSFPSQIEHTIEWARDKFESLFNHKPLAFSKFWDENKKGDNFRHTVLAMAERLMQDENVKDALLVVKLLGLWPNTWPECVSLARWKLEKYFNHRAKHLVHVFPLDTKMEDGSLFWSLPKRPPQPVVFSAHDRTHMRFIESTASLFANVFRVKIPSDEAERLGGIESGLSEAKVPDFVPSNKRIETDEGASKPINSSEEYFGDIRTLGENLLKFSNKLVEFPPTMSIENFEKDDDSNHHIDFISSAANLRGVMYGIDPVDRLEAKRIAGRIIPAISTTTAAVAGLATLQFLQLSVQQLKRKNSSMDSSEELSAVNLDLCNYRNCFLNLALPLVVLSEPAPAEKMPITKKLSFTLWDRWSLVGNKDFTLKDFIEYFRTKYLLDVSMVMQGTRMVYVPIMPGHSKRLGQPMAKLIKMAKPVPNYVDLIIAFINKEDEDGEDLSCPIIRYYFEEKGN
nr:ubiquitin/FAT10-activating enzyme [Halocynthia roretzi]